MVTTPGDLSSRHWELHHFLEMPTQIEQFCHSYVAAPVCARSVALLLLVSLLLLVNHFMVRPFLGLAKPFWVAGFSVRSNV